MQRRALGPPTARQQFGIVFAPIAAGVSLASLPFRRCSLRSVSAVLALTVVTATIASAQPAAPYLQASVGAAQTVIAVWNAVPGATGYRAEAGISPLPDAGRVRAGRQRHQLRAPGAAGHLLPAGLRPQRPGHQRARPTSSGSAVSSTLGPPAPPTGFAASSAGTTVNLVGRTAGRPADRAGAGRRHGPGADASRRAVAPGAQRDHLQNVPPGTYYARVHALGPGGPSGPSNEVAIVVAPAACLAPALPAVTATATRFDGDRLVDAGRRRRRLHPGGVGNAWRLADGQPAGGRRHHQRRLSRRARRAPTTCG